MVYHNFDILKVFVYATSGQKFLQTTLLHLDSRRTWVNANRLNFAHRFNIHRCFPHWNEWTLARVQPIKRQLTKAATIKQRAVEEETQQRCSSLRCVFKGSIVCRVGSDPAWTPVLSVQRAPQLDRRCRLQRVT